MADEKFESFKYYIPYLVVENGKQTGAGYRFAELANEIETEDDVKVVMRAIEKEGGLALKSIILLPWKRLQ